MQNGQKFWPSHNVSEHTPDRFDVPPGYDPLDFYYTTATFRDSDGRTSADVYFGIPPSARPDTLDGRTVTHVNRAAVLGTDPEGRDHGGADAEPELPERPASVVLLRGPQPDNQRVRPDTLPDRL